MGQNLSSTQEVDTSLDTLAPFRPQERRLLVIWLLSAYGMACIWFIFLLCDRWERRGRRLGVVLHAVSLSIVWPLVAIYLIIAGPSLSALVAESSAIVATDAPYHITGSPVAAVPDEDTSAAKHSPVTFDISAEHNTLERHLEAEREQTRLLILERMEARRIAREGKGKGRAVD
ncbi:hypothetical protein N431DRAFT_431836 [Stipitochalara longipes BDJ]|nr:hypothetical protein N431DRAFT_431836 [Stipitochalara longipes BDJ]